MKTRSFSSNLPAAACRREWAFTMTEMMVSATLFLLLVVGVLYGYMFGLNMYQITRVKLGASDDTRKAVIRLTDEIRSAWKVQIGTGDLSTFTEVASNALQQGNALRIYMETDSTNTWIRYWYQTNAAAANYSKLLRTEDGFVSSLVIANSITNAVPIFTAEDPNGNILNNNINNQVIGLTLQFYQLEYPRVNIGAGNYYDFYQLHTRITRRTLY